MIRLLPRYIQSNEFDSVMSEKAGNGPESTLKRRDECSICLEPTDCRGFLHGCCDHYFCFDCILQWSRISSLCPLCKRRFASIVRVRGASSASPGIGTWDKKDVTHVPKVDVLPEWNERGDSFSSRQVAGRSMRPVSSRSGSSVARLQYRHDRQLRMQQQVERLRQFRRRRMRELRQVALSSSSPPLQGASSLDRHKSQLAESMRLCEPSSAVFQILKKNEDLLRRLQEMEDGPRNVGKKRLKSNREREMRHGGVRQLKKKRKRVAKANGDDCAHGCK